MGPRGTQVNQRDRMNAQGCGLPASVPSDYNLSSLSSTNDKNAIERGSSGILFNFRIAGPIDELHSFIKKDS